MRLPPFSGAQRARDQVRFSSESREHTFDVVDPPTQDPSCLQPPPTPFLGTVPLTSSPELAQLAHEDEAATSGEPDALGTPNEPTEPNILILDGVGRAPVLQMQWEAPPPSSLPSAQADLSQYLQRLPIPWNVREDSSDNAERLLDRPAFHSHKMSCVLSFCPRPGDAWTVEVRVWGRPLTVGDVLHKIEEELYKPLDGSTFYSGHAWMAAAEAQRPTRKMGAQDAVEGIFRGVDLYDARWPFFFGLKAGEAPGGDDGVLYHVKFAPGADL